jgi:hypothetical protein
LIAASVKTAATGQRIAHGAIPFTIQDNVAMMFQVISADNHISGDEGASAQRRYSRTRAGQERLVRQVLRSWRPSPGGFQGFGRNKN